MVYKISICDNTKLPFPEAVKDGELATASVELDGIVLIQGIKIKQNENDGYMYVEMPRLKDVYSRSVVNFKARYAAIPTTKDYAKELYSNIIKTYLSESQVMGIDIAEPDTTDYKINVYSSEDKDIEGVVDLELDDCIKLRGMKLRKNYDGEFFLQCPQVTSDDKYSIPAFEFWDDEFEKHLIKNVVSVLEERKIKIYSDDDKAEYIKIEQGISKEESDIKLCERMTTKICEDLGEIDNDLEFKDLNIAKKEELLSRQKKLNDMLGQFTYAHYVADNNIKQYKSIKEGIQKKYENQFNNKKKGGSGR